MLITGISLINLQAASYSSSGTLRHAILYYSVGFAIIISSRLKKKNIDATLAPVSRQELKIKEGGEGGLEQVTEMARQSKLVYARRSSLQACFHRSTHLVQSFSFDIISCRPATPNPLQSYLWVGEEKKLNLRRPGCGVTLLPIQVLSVDQSRPQFNSFDGLGSLADACPGLK